MQTVDLKTPDFSERVREAALQYRRLLIPSADVLADTIIWLDRMVQLSERLLAINGYFYQVRDHQLQCARASLYADIAFKDLKASNPEEFESVRTRLQASSLLVLDEKIKSLSEADAISIKQAEQHFLCTEDVFIAACAFLSVDIAKQGSVYYLQGQSPAFKETKKNRSPINLTEESTLCELAFLLKRPKDARGKIEQGYIESAERHLTSMYKLYCTMLAMVAYSKQREAEGKSTTKTDLCKVFGTSLTDYERAMAMARRLGLLTFKRKKEQPNAYSLNSENEKFVLAVAAQRGVTPLKALNLIISDWRASMLLRRKVGTLGNAS